MRSAALRAAVVLASLAAPAPAALAGSPHSPHHGNLAAQTRQAAGDPTSAEIRLFAFHPAALTVPVGAAVRWTNQDPIEHSVTHGTPEARGEAFDSGLFGQAQSFTVSFTAAGEYAYFCTKHPSMRGTISVGQPGAPAGHSAHAGAPEQAPPTPTLGQPAQPTLPRGAVLTLRGTPHLWVAGDDGALHWAGDTRALGGVAISWDTRREVTLDELRRYRIGDPWLSAGLVKLGDPIYLAKWEANQSVPTLYHIQSIADTELFGINAGNYGRFVLEGSVWSQRYGFAAETLPRDTLGRATT